MNANSQRECWSHNYEWQYSGSAGAGLTLEDMDMFVERECEQHFHDNNN
jgi:hypothetical protein